MTYNYPPQYLEHHGIKGMKWGVRRYQNPDGTRINSSNRRYERGKNLYNKGFKKENLKEDTIMTYNYPPQYLEHHGIKGMKWGVRRYQNPDGTRINSSNRRYERGKNLYNKGFKKENLQEAIDSSYPMFAIGLALNGLSFAGLIAASPIIMIPATGIAAGSAFTMLMAKTAIKDLEEYEKTLKE